MELRNREALTMKKQIEDMKVEEEKAQRDKQVKAR